MARELISHSPEETFEFGRTLAAELAAGDVVLLQGGLGAGKTLLTKGILAGLDFDIDEVTSPSFTLVNLYHTAKFDVHHIDLWRLEASADPAFDVGLYEIMDQENAIAIIEWSEMLRDRNLGTRNFLLSISGDGDEPRHITLRLLNDESK